jgi:hypothetical protein
MVPAMLAAPISALYRGDGRNRISTRWEVPFGHLREQRYKADVGVFAWSRLGGAAVGGQAWPVVPEVCRSSPTQSLDSAIDPWHVACDNQDGSRRRQSLNKVKQQWAIGTLAPLGLPQSNVLFALENLQSLVELVFDSSARYRLEPPPEKRQE